MSKKKKKFKFKKETNKKESKFVEVYKEGGWKVDVYRLVNSPAYKRQVKALKDLRKKNSFSK